MIRNPTPLRRCVSFASAAAALACFVVRGHAVTPDYVFLPRSTFDAGSGAAEVVAHDWNNDNLVDLAVSNRSSQTISIHLNNGGGWLVRSSAVFAGPDPRFMAVADFDLDGDLDIIASNFNDSLDRLTKLLNDGQGRFENAGHVFTIGRPRGVASADFNGDGLDDLAVASSLPSSVNVLFNMGNNRFSAPTTYQVGSNTGSVAVVDLDRDGNVDILATNRNSNTISTLRNIGNGVFVFSGSLPTGLGPKAEAAGDLNADGWPDAVVVNGNDDTISIYMNNGSGELALASTIASGPSPHDVALGDLDLDGDLDIVAADIGAPDQASVLFNLDGKGSFGGLVGHPAGPDPAAIVLRDFDGDGRLDAVTADSNSSSISVFPTIGLRDTVHAGGLPPKN